MIVTGGNTLLQGFIERLNRELLSKTPPVSIVTSFTFLVVVYAFNIMLSSLSFSNTIDGVLTHFQTLERQVNTQRVYLSNFKVFGIVVKHS